MEDLIRVGVITSTHGVRGEVKVFPTTDTPERFRSLKRVVLKTRDGEKELEIKHVKFFKQMVIVRFDGIDDIADAERYRDQELYVTRKDAAPLADDEYYYADLIGLHVVTDTGEAFGVLKDVIETGANDVYVIRREDGSEVLIPAIRECILAVDPAAGLMRIHLMKGLV